MKKTRRKFVKELGFISMGTIILPNLKLTANNITQAKKINIPGGIASCAGVTNNGWYAASLVISDDNRHSFSDSNIDSNIGFEERGNLLQKWIAEEHMGCSAKLVLTTSWQTSVNKELACDKSILFPVSPRETTASPVVVFVSRDENKWYLNLYRNGEVSKLYSSNNSIRYPSVISIKNDIIISYEQDNDNEGHISLVNSQGEIIYQTQGRRAKLVKAGDKIVLMKEICTNNSITTCIELIGNNKQENIWHLPEEDDYTFNGDICYSEGKLYVVAETTHAFGQDDRMGNFRELRAWHATLSDRNFKPVAEQSLIPVPEQTSTWKKENLSPIRPIIFIEGSVPVVLYRQFRDAGFKKFGWDLFKTEIKNGKWCPPVRITENIISPNTAFGLIQQRDSYILTLPSFDNNGPRIDGGPVVPTNHRIEIINQNKHTTFPLIIGNGSHTYKFEESIGYKNIAQKPPELPCKTDGRFLIWGDMHVHSSYSKCIASMNGMPDEMFRYQRDILQNEVICSLEHSIFMKGSEQKYVYDLLEAESSNNHIVLFGDEPGMLQGRHTNFYAYRRDVIEQLRNIVILYERDRYQTYKAIKAFIKKDALLITRHFHGNLYSSEKEMLDSFDPELEWVFEAMQGRTNAMMDENYTVEKFPNVFLNGGKKVGLYGGTDHYRGVGPNHYCLTGFWVKEFSPEGVWEALKNRKTIAVSDAKIAMFATLNNKLFGEEMTVQQSDMIFKVNLSSAHPVKKVGLMRDGEMLDWLPVNNTIAQIELTDTTVARGYHWYCITTEVESVYEDTAIGHISPFFVEVI